MTPCRTKAFAGHTWRALRQPRLLGLSLLVMGLSLGARISNAQGSQSVPDAALLKVPNLPRPDDSGKEQATIALFESFSTPGLSAVVRRTKGNSGKVLIAIKRSSLSPELLNAVFQSIPNSKGSLRAGSARADLYFRDDRKLPAVTGAANTEMQKVVKELLQATAKPVQGFGKRQVISRDF